MRIGNFEHKPSLVIVIAYLVAAAIMLGLGSWQVSRAAEKTEILAAAAIAREQAPIAPQALGDLSVAAKSHQRIAVQGIYDEARQFLWDNRVHQGQAGFEVITPLVMDNGGVLLVNRGWIAPGATRQDLPSLALPETVAGEAVEITGFYSQPSKGLASGAAFPDDGVWPKVLQYFDYAAIAEALNVDVLADSGARSEAGLLPGVTQPQVVGSAVDREDFLIANWEPTAAIGPARHYSYAFQWFAMAFALTVLYVVYNTKKLTTS